MVAKESIVLFGTAQHSTARHIIAQHSTAQHSIAHHSTARHITARYSTAQHSTAQHGTAQHITAQHSTARPSTSQHSAAWPSTAQHSSAQHNTADLARQHGLSDKAGTPQQNHVTLRPATLQHDDISRHQAVRGGGSDPALLHHGRQAALVHEGHHFVVLPRHDAANAMYEGGDQDVDQQRI